jgi:hypothetical protein
MSDIFISYGRKDQPKARRLADALAALGWSVWWDPKIQSGKAFDRVIESAIAEAKCVVVVWSKHSVNSDWVRAEAANGLSRNILISVAVDENLALPLRFSQVHTEDLSAWDGDTASTEFVKLASDISAIVKTDGPVQKADGGIFTDQKQLPVRSVLLSVAGLLLSIVFLSLYLGSVKEKDITESPQQLFYLILICAAISALLFGLLQVYAHKTMRRLPASYKLAVPAVGILLTVVSGFFLPHNLHETDLTIRVLDKQKKSVTEGTVKVDVPQVQEQQINKSGEVKFKGIPKNQLAGKIRLYVSSPGYSDHTFDTVLPSGHPLEIVLTEPSVIKIGGRVEDAGEMPIRDVEVSVENTRYYTHTLTDGTYFLTVTAYASGDEIVLRTSHPGYEDKLVHLGIKTPATQVPDIVLKPVN